MSGLVGDMPPVGLPERVSAPDAPYLTTDYWAGQELDARLRISKATAVPALTKTGMKFAARAVEYILPAGHDTEYVRTFAPGEHFDSWRYALGTTVIFNQELLFPAAADSSPVDMGKLAELVADRGEPVPEAPTTLEPPLGDMTHPYASPRYVVGGDLVSLNWLRYGVVVPSRKGKTHDKRLISLHAASAYRTRGKGAKGLVPPDELLSLDKDRAGFQAEPHRLTVGKVYHLHRRIEGKGGGAAKHVTVPTLMRVGALAVYRTEEGWAQDLST